MVTSNGAEQEKLSHKIFRTASFGFFSYVLAIMFSVFITPIVLRHLGLVDYGVYVLVNTVIAFMNLFDLGLSTALSKYVAEYHAQGNFLKLSRLANSANTIYLIAGTLGLLVFVIIGKYLLPFFHISNQSQHNIVIVFFLAGLVFFVNSINSVFYVIPNALQRPDLVIKINTIQYALLNLLIVFLVVHGLALKAIFAATLAFNIVTTFVFRRLCKKMLPSLNFGFAWAKEEVSKSLSFGFFVALNNLATNALIQLDRLLVPLYLSPSLLTLYSLPGNVAQKTSGVTGSLVAIVFPLTSALNGVGNTERIKEVYQKFVRNLFMVSAALTTSITAFAYQILYYWLGKEVADKGYNILIILAFTYFILAIYSPVTNFFMGMGKVKFMFYVSSGTAVLNLILLLFLLPRFGIVGAAWSYFFAVVPAVGVIYYFEKKFFGLQGRGLFYLGLLSKNILVAAIVFATVKFALLKLVGNVYSLLLFGPASVLLYFALYKLFGFYEQEDWELVKNYLLKILNIKTA